MNPDISCVFDGLSHKGAIYISNITAAQNTTLLKSIFLHHCLDLSINAIVSALPFKITKN